MLAVRGRKWGWVALAMVSLAGCDEMPDLKMPDWTVFGQDKPPQEAPVPEVTEELPSPDETTPPPLGGSLGTTVVSLGAAGEPGMWLKTPLVDRERKGRVYHDGLWLAVTLMPIEGPPTAGSRMSLSAMRALELPLTELTEVRVTAD